MNILLSQRKLIGVSRTWQIKSNYIGICDNLVMLIFDATDIIDISSIKYKKIFVIIADTQETKQDVNKLITLCRLIIKCNDEDIYLETPSYPFEAILKNVKKKLHPDYISWLACLVLLIMFLFFILIIMATIRQYLL